MIAKWFRFPEEDNEGWIGLAVARDKKELFWTIDEHGDPYAVEIKSVISGSVCLLVKGYDVVDVEEKGYDVVDVEESEFFPMLGEEGWKKPHWPEDVIRGEI